MASVEIRGADAAGFLHAQLTSDVAALAPGDVALSAWCTPRGQVRCLFWLVRRADGTRFSLVAPTSEAEDLAHRLRAFVLRAKVEVERTGDRVVGAAGPGSEAFVAGQAGRVPAPGSSAESGDRFAIRPSGARIASSSRARSASSRDAGRRVAAAGDRGRHRVADG